MNKYVKIICIIDKSGSMNSIKNDAIGGFNNFVNQQKELQGDALISVILFDEKMQVLYKDVDIKKAELLNDKNYVPSNGTALLDACGFTIDNEIDWLGNTPNEERPKKTICIINTDGDENSSKIYNNSLIKKLITEMREDFNWEFIFLGANIDSFTTANNLGISVGNTQNYDATSKGVTVAYSNINDAVTYYRSSNEKNDNIFEEIKK